MLTIPQVDFNLSSVLPSQTKLHHTYIQFLKIIPQKLISQPINFLTFFNSLISKFTHKFSTLKKKLKLKFYIFFNFPAKWTHTRKTHHHQREIIRSRSKAHGPAHLRSTKIPTKSKNHQLYQNHLIIHPLYRQPETNR